MKPLPDFIPEEQRNARITLSMTVPDPHFWANLDRLRVEHDARQEKEARHDLLILKRGYSVLHGIELTASVPVLLYSTAEGIGCLIGGEPQEFDMQGYTPEELHDLREFLAKDNAARGSSTSNATPQTRQDRQPLPKQLSQATFIEARATVHAISDGRDGRHWRTVDGALALLHYPPKADHQVRFEPNNLLVTWWGNPTPGIKTLWDELASLEFDAVVTFKVTLAAILHEPKARWATSIDDIIKLIGRDTDARRSKAERQKWRRKVWRWLLFFDSLAVIGARPGTWKEPAPKGQKGDRMPREKLVSRDPLLRIVGTRDTEQGSFDKSEPPKEVSLVPGEWLMQFHGDRRFLAEFGDVLNIASIARGKPSGAWAACIGFMLQQLWREEASHAKRNRVGEEKHETLAYRAFTRRELLTGTLRSGHDINEILSDPKSSHRAREYWTGAIKELKRRGIIGHYAEGNAPSHDDWREAWLDQPLYIRPKAALMQDALEISHSADEARKRGRRRLPKPKAQEESAD